MIPTLLDARPRLCKTLEFDDNEEDRRGKIDSFMCQRPPPHGAHFAFGGGCICSGLGLSGGDVHVGLRVCLHIHVCMCICIISVKFRLAPSQVFIFPMVVSISTIAR